MPDEEKKPYGPVRYGPPTPTWAEKDEKRRRGHEARDRKFIEAIMDEEKKKGHPISWEQARRELARQTRVSQRELLWQEHRTTLKELHLTTEQRDRGVQQKITKRMAPRPEDELANLRAENANLKEQLEAVTESYKLLNSEFQRWKKEHP